MVRHVLEDVRPQRVLIEGPADMNDRLGELDRRHTLPVAVFSFYQAKDRTHASWSPFCAYSPEWVALRDGRRLGADVRFMDLPAWSDAFAGLRNRYADRSRPQLGYVAQLCERLGVDGMDALWDHLFELDVEPGDLRERLASYFDALRADGGDDERDAGREAFMASCVAWANAQDGDTVVVCGGYHKPHLQRAYPQAEARWPDLPEPEEGARHGSFVVPYSFHRLDSFVGYQAGMPSPAYYQAVWEKGAETAASTMLRKVVARLRKKKQAVSAADLIGVETMARGLMRLRSHAVMARSDLLDGVAASLVKDALDHPLPWTERGTLKAGTDPILVEVMRVLSGDREGKLAKGTPRPPLTDDVEEQLRDHALQPGPRPRDVALDLTKPADEARSFVLHRLRLLRIPGFERSAGPAHPAAAELDENWSLRRTLDADARLVEAAAWGGTLESAAAGFLEERVRDADGDLAMLTEILLAALMAGLQRLGSDVLQLVSTQIGGESDVGRLGNGLERFVNLWRHDARHGSTIGPVIAAMLDRGLWLYEGLQGANAELEDGHIIAARGLRDAVRYCGERLQLDVDAATAMMERRVRDPDAPLAVRGASLGFVWSLRPSPDTAARALAAVRGSALPDQLGAFLAGLFALAREESTRDAALLAVVDELIVAMTSNDFLLAVPPLRLAFGFFPPREKDRLARSVLARHNEGDEKIQEVRRLPTDADTLTAGHELDAKLDALEQRWGLAPEADR